MQSYDFKIKMQIFFFENFERYKKSVLVKKKWIEGK